MINPKIKQTIPAAIKAFAEHNAVESDQIIPELEAVFQADKDFLAKVKDLDAAFDNHPHLEALREVFFDLLLVNFFSADVKKLEDDYLDSPAWEKIEEKTLDRGTELLNVLLYLNECDDEDIEPGLEDYLKEFLLVDDDEFQDEHRIYEDIIANQTLMDSSLKEIARVGQSLDPESEIGDLFYPIMAFFYNPKPEAVFNKEFAGLSADPEFDAAVLAIITTYHQAR